MNGVHATSALTSIRVQIGQALSKGPWCVNAHKGHAHQDEHPSLHQIEVSLPAGASYAAGSN